MERQGWRRQFGGTGFNGKVESQGTGTGVKRRAGNETQRWAAGSEGAGGEGDGFVQSGFRPWTPLLLGGSMPFIAGVIPPLRPARDLMLQETAARSEFEKREAQASFLTPPSPERWMVEPAHSKIK